jgi:hypothetical protein
MVRILASGMELRRTADSMRKTGIEYSLLARGFAALGSSFPVMPPGVASFVGEVLARVNPTLTQLAHELVEDSAELNTRANWFEAAEGEPSSFLGPLIPALTWAGAAMADAKRPTGGTLAVTRASERGTATEIVPQDPDELDRLLDLGPRPEPGWREPVSLPKPLFDAVIGPGRPYSRSEISMLLAEEPGTPHRRADVLSLLSYGAHTRWRITGAGETAIDVLDAGEKGYWLVDEAGDEIRLEPSSTVEVKARLQAFLNR